MVQTVFCWYSKFRNVQTYCKETATHSIMIFQRQKLKREHSFLTPSRFSQDDKWGKWCGWQGANANVYLLYL